MDNKLDKLKVIPFFKTINNYNSSKLKSDLIAGLSVAALSLPQNMAYALIIGIQPVYGIYATIVAMILFTLVGFSNYMIVGPTNIMAMALVAGLSGISQSNYLAALFLLTFIAGIFQLLFGLLKLGRFVNYVSHSLIVGLSTGAVVMIAAGQLKNFLGIKVDAGSTLYSKLYSIFSNLNLIDLQTLILASFTVIIILAIQKYKPKLPAYLIGLVSATVVVYLLGLRNEISVVGTLPSGIIKFNFISFEWSQMSELIPGAVSVAVIGLIQTLAVSKSIALESGEDIDMNREFVGQGIINMVGPFFSSFATAGSFAKSYANLQVGAKTRFSQFTAGISVVIILLLFKSFIAYIPIAGLAGLVIVVAVKSIKIDSIIRNLKTTRGDAAIFLVTFLSTIMLPSLDTAIYIGLIISFAVVLKKNEGINLSVLDYENNDKNRINESSLKKIDKKDENNQWLVVNISGDLHFNSAENLKEMLTTCFQKSDNFIIRLRRIERMDITVIKELDEFIKRVKEDDGEIFLSGVNKENYKRLKNYGLLDRIKEENIFFSRDRLFAATNKAYYNATKKD